MPSAYLQWRFHSGERVVARGPLVSNLEAFCSLPLHAKEFMFILLLPCILPYKMVLELEDCLY